jgi:ATP-dependent DNA helicase RecQ
MTDKGQTVLKGKKTPRLLKPAEKKSEYKARSAAESWEGVDAGLFEELRAFRKREAAEKGVPPFVIFGDVTLRELAKVRPSTPQILVTVKGIGSKKRQQYGRAVLTIIKKYCEKYGLEMDTETDQALPNFGRSRRKKPNHTKQQAFELFAQGRSIQQVAPTINRAKSTTVQYLCEFIQKHGVSEPSPWVDGQTARNIHKAIQKVGSKQLKLIYNHLNGQVDYNKIRITLACLRNI